MHFVILALFISLFERILNNRYLYTVYYVFCNFSELLKIRPNPNNGTKGSMHHAMVSPKALNPQLEPDPPAVGVVPQDETEYKFRIYASNCSCSMVWLIITFHTVVFDVTLKEWQYL